MNILVVGLSHQTASVEIREKLSITEAKLKNAFAQLLELPNIQEVAIVSTCNRLEIYTVVGEVELGTKQIVQFLCEIARVSLCQLYDCLFTFTNREAVLHLMRVAAGLESLIIGEGQILCQIKQSHKFAQIYKGLGKLLDRLFKQAITAGKRVRNEVKLTTGAVSISSAAVELAQIKVQNLAVCNISIVGAGKMSYLLVKHLLAKGVTKISIVNRSLEGAEKLAGEFPKTELQLHSLSEIMTAIAKSDIVFTSTCAEKPILDRTKIQTIQPISQPLRLFDISIPRNVNPNIYGLENVELYNVDDLKALVVRNQENRRQMARKAEVLLQEEVESFGLWWRSLETVPTIKSLRHKVESICEEELRKTLSRLDAESAQKHEKIFQALARGISNKILHEPTVQLRIQQDSEVQRLALQTLQMLFNLDTERQHTSFKKISYQNQFLSNSISEMEQEKLISITQIPEIIPNG